MASNPTNEFVAAHRESRIGQDDRLPEDVRLSWACRSLEQQRDYLLVRNREEPRAGDVALVEVQELRNHKKIVTADNSRLAMYPGDRLVAVFGNRYATGAFEAVVQTTDDLALVTGGGMIGTVLSKNRVGVKSPTSLSFLGYVADEDGRQINLKEEMFRPARLDQTLPQVIFVVGAGMDSGKTQASAKLTKGLLDKNFRVAACKLTGSVSHRDLFEMRSTFAHDTRDFSDYGFPSTYLCGRAELESLFETMLVDAAKAKPDVVVIELADGVLQRETRMLLESEQVRRHVSGIVLASPCAPSALFGIERIEGAGHQVLAVSGVITNSPLFIRELEDEAEIPVGSSCSDGHELASIVLEGIQKQNAATLATPACSK